MGAAGSSTRHAGKKLGILISAQANSLSFRHGVGVAKAAMEAGAQVYVYFIDGAIGGLNLPEAQALGKAGCKLFGCAFSARERGVPLAEEGIYGGLTLLNDVISATDKFVSFN